VQKKGHRGSVLGGSELEKVRPGQIRKKHLKNEKRKKKGAWKRAVENYPASPKTPNANQDGPLRKG